MTSNGDKVAVQLNIDSGGTKTAATITVDLDQTAGSLLDQVAERVGFDPDYIVLYHRWDDSMNFKEGSRTTDSNFKASNRIGCSSMCDNQAEMNSVKLRDYNIRMNSDITCLIRPMRGDHIHQAIAIYVHGELVDTLWDQDFLRTPNANEGNTYPVTFSDLSVGMYDYHITQSHPHFGIHAGQAYWFGDGLIHVHPGTSWGWFRHTTGTGAVLDMFMEQVGAAIYGGESIWYPMGHMHVPGKGNEMFSSMTFPDKTGGNTTMVGGEYDCAAMLQNGIKGQNIGPNRHPLRDFENVQHTPYEMTPENIIIQSNATHVWRLYYWRYFNQTEPAEVLTRKMGSLWLGNNLAMITLSFEPIDADTTRPRKPPQCMIDMMTNLVGRETGTPVPHQQSDYYILGFDGFPYPMPNAQGMGWPLPKPQYITPDSILYPRVPKANPTNGSGTTFESIKQSIQPENDISSGWKSGPDAFIVSAIVIRLLLALF